MGDNPSDDDDAAAADASSSSSGAATSSSSSSGTATSSSSSSGGSSGTSSSSSGGALDGGSDAATARCDPSKEWQTPVNETTVNSGDDEASFALSRDERTAVFYRFSGSSQYRLTGATRASRDVPFGEPNPAPFANINATGSGTMLLSKPSLSPTGQYLYYNRQNNSTSTLSIEVAELPQGGNVYAAGVTVSFLTNGGLDVPFAAFISASGQNLYATQRSVFNLISAERRDQASSFTAPHAVTTPSVGNPAVSADELTLYFQDDAGDIRRVSRAATNVSFDAGAATAVPNINSANEDYPAWLSEDDCVMYLLSKRPGGNGGFDVWRSQRAQ